MKNMGVHFCTVCQKYANIVRHVKGNFSPTDILKEKEINETTIDTVDDNYSEENYMTTEEKSFTTSTPRKRKFECDE